MLGSLIKLHLLMNAEWIYLILRLGAFLIEEMHKFFNNQEVAQAEGFVEPTKDSGDAVKSFTPPPPPII